MFDIFSYFMFFGLAMVNVVYIVLSGNLIFKNFYVQM